MQNIFNQFRDSYQIHLQASRHYTNATLSGTAKLGDVTKGMAQRFFHNQMQLAEAMSTAHDKKSVLN
jgi:hypothetical protein